MQLKNRTTTRWLVFWNYLEFSIAKVEIKFIIKLPRLVFIYSTWAYQADKSGGLSRECVYSFKDFPLHDALLRDFFLENECSKISWIEEIFHSSIMHLSLRIQHHATRLLRVGYLGIIFRSKTSIFTFPKYHN